MTINTRKYNSSIHRYLFSVTAVAFVLTIVAVGASFAQSPSDNPQSSAKRKPIRAMSNAMLDPAKTPPAQPSLLIDSFKVGPFSTHSVASSGNNIPNIQTKLNGSELINGSRTSYLSFDNPDKQPVSVEVLPDKPALVLSAGYKVSPRLELTYTVPKPSADLISKYDRFLIDFDGLDHGMDLAITAYGVDPKVDGHTGEVCPILPPQGPFTLSIPFSRFAAPDIFKTTNAITFIFQHTSGGLDYAITRITAAKGDPEHIVTCSK
jgi:hypothetical protein